MKTSELIKQLQEYIKVAGDWEVVISTPNDYYNIVQVCVCDEGELEIEVI